jgi:hypothetical protein
MEDVGTYILWTFGLSYGLYYILWTFGIVRGNMVYFSRFGILYQEKSGNPDWLLPGKRLMSFSRLNFRRR